MWPLIRRFGLLALAVVALWLVSVLILNLTLFSAGGHVLSYLRAMESGDYGLAATKAGLSRANDRDGGNIGWEPGTQLANAAFGVHSHFRHKDTGTSH